MTQVTRPSPPVGGRNAPQLQLTESAIADLVPNPANARHHSARQITLLAKSMRAFGAVVPILIDDGGTIICGHARVQAALKLGWTHILSICVTHLDENQKKALALADNRLSEISTWNEKLLAAQLKDLSLQKLDFEIEATGFEIGEIDFRIQSLDLQSDGGPDPADQVPNLVDTQPVTRLGDLWALGPHRIHCGDALDESAFNRLMSGEVASAVITDPPFNVKIDGHATGLGKHRHREFAMASGEMTAAEFTAFLAHSMTLLRQYSVDGSLNYFFIDWRHIAELLAAGAQYTELKNICVWAKTNAGMGSLYRSQHELVAVFKHGTAPHRNNIQLGRFGRHRTNVWNYPGANSLSRSGEDNPLALHPTVKPVALLADAIQDCTARGDIILDPFLGIGSLVLAAERVGRRCYGIEIDPLYVDNAVRRWQRLTGDVARHVTGLTFQEIEEERHG